MRSAVRTHLAVGLVLALTPAAAASATLPGTWRRIPSAPIAPDEGAAGAWTGSRLLVVGSASVRAEDGAVLSARNVAATYEPAARRWRALPRPPGNPRAGSGHYAAAWTGSEALVWGPGTHAAFAPASARWRTLPRPPADTTGLVAWTGTELVGWGGGCCVDAFAIGGAYVPARDAWRTLAPSPLAPSQHPAGAWTGTELIIVVGDRDPDGHPWPARLARAAAYDPSSGRWRRLAPPPLDRAGAEAVWDGRELLLVGGTTGTGGALARVGLAYAPATDTWRRLAPMPAGRANATAVWSGSLLLLWGGSAQAGQYTMPGHGLAYDPAANRWSALPPAPVPGRLDPIASWTGRSMLVWGGTDPYQPFADGAELVPVPLDQPSGRS
jgi:hypothetical protein